MVTYEWLTDTFQLWDYQRKRAPPSLYHPGKDRDGKAISDLFKKSEQKPKAVKKATPVAADTTAVYGGDEDAAAAEEAVGNGMEHLTISEKKESLVVVGEEISQKISEGKVPQKVSEAGDGRATQAADGIKGASTPVNKESGKPAGKPEKNTRVKDQEPPVDLSLYAVCEDESGLHQVEVWKPDRHGNARGCRWVLELYESKSVPKTYLFGATKYPNPGSGACIRRFPSKAPRDKEHELQELRFFFWNRTRVLWRQRDSMPSKGPFYYLSPAVSGKAVGGGSHKNTFDQLGERKDWNPTGSVAVPHEHHDSDRKTSVKRKRSFSEERPTKAFKVTKPVVTSDSANANNGGSKTA